MKILLVTEKFKPDNNQRDGGSRLVSTLQYAFAGSIEIMQFGAGERSNSTWSYTYPHYLPCRFARRLANSDYIIEKIKAVEHNFTHVIFIHISMQFGIAKTPLRESIKIITFPMFLTTSYHLSGEKVSENYFEMEKAALKFSNLILTPSYLEKRQLIEHYAIDGEKIRVIPRGVDTRYIKPVTKSFEGNLNCCSVGSIKPQKNTIGLVYLFADIVNKYPNTKLKIVGPIQDEKYYQKVIQLVNNLNLNSSIEFTGYIPPDQLSVAIQSSHLHISTSLCETFGRSIFETLAAGIPNIARKENNAAAEFLSNLPYVHFVNNNNEVLMAIEKLIDNFEVLSSLAMEVGGLYDDKFLSRLLSAEIFSQNMIAISDYDGTIYHKDNPAKTRACIESFLQFPMRVICSARTVEDIVNELGLHQLEVDWIIACSGAVISDGKGNKHRCVPLSEDHISLLRSLNTDVHCISIENDIVQICMPAHQVIDALELRTEIYQNRAYVAHWQASKLHAVHWLLNHIGYNGKVRVFGDGKYDLEMITYFNGTLVSI